MEEREPAIFGARRPDNAGGDTLALDRAGAGVTEAYWAAIATLVAMQSSFSSTFDLAIERIVASALGACLGAIESTYFGQNLIAFALAVFLLGLISLVFRIEKIGYRYGSITLVIVVLIPRADLPWMIAMHRFIGVSLGIVVALAVAAVWREEKRTLARTDAEEQPAHPKC